MEAQKESASTAHEPLRCRVCDAKNAARHYGGLACGSCKVFFARAISNNVSYKCASKGSCDVVYGKKTCSACRYDKCLKIKMLPHEVGRLRLKRSKVSSAQKCTSPSSAVGGSQGTQASDTQGTQASDTQGTQVPGTQGTQVCSTQLPGAQNVTLQVALPSSTTSCQLFSFKEELPSIEPASAVPYIHFPKSRPCQFRLNLPSKSFQLFSTEEIVNIYLKLESFCDHDDKVTQIPKNVRIDLGVNVLEALEDPSKFCARTPIGWDASPSGQQSSLDQLKGLYSRLALHYFDYLAAHEEIMHMSDDDKKLLVTSQMLYVVTHVLAYNSYKYGASGMLWSHGYEVPVVSDDPAGHQMSVLAVELQHRLVEPFHQLKITPAEYAIFKRILLFRNECVLSDAGQETVNKVRLETEQLFVNHINEEYKEQTDSWRLHRICSFFALLPQYQFIVQFSGTYFTYVVASNLGNMRDKLTYDLHLGRNAPGL